MNTRCLAPSTYLDVTTLNDRSEAVLYGAAIRGLRTRKGWTQEQAAKFAGMSTGRLSSLERGEHVRAFPNAIRDIARTFGVESRRIPGVVDSLRTEARTVGSVDLFSAAKRYWGALDGSLTEHRYCLVDVSHDPSCPQLKCSNPTPLPAGSYALTLVLYTDDPAPLDVLWVARDASEGLVSANVLRNHHHVWSTSVTAEAVTDGRARGVEAIFVR